jgi:sterol desaturase/sphingolipid hydroxylase (fatty acid hydroxylase superfamily)
MISLIFNSLYLILTEAQYQFLRALYRGGLLTRAQPFLPENRDICLVLVGASSVTLPLGLLTSYYHDYLSSVVSVEFCLFEILIVQIFMYVSVDTWYFWGHRLMHRNRFLWRFIHQYHHEKSNITVYTTACAAFLENLILVSPVVSPII